MTKRMLIDATHAEETRVVVLDGNRLEDFDVETETKRQLKGNIYLAKVVRVEPSLQAAFVEYGGGRHGFLAFSEIHPDYYQIPVADRQRLLELQAQEAREEAEAEEAAVTAVFEPPPVAPDGPQPDLSVPPATWTDIGSGPASLPPSEAASAHNGPAHVPGAAAAVAVEDAASSATLTGAADAAARPAEAESDSAGPASIGFAGAVEESANRPAQAAVIERDERFGPVAEVEPLTNDIASPSPMGGEDDVTSAEAEPTDADLSASEMPPPETIGGETDGAEEIRARRTARFLRNYRIQEVIKRRQIMLVQVVKEERGTKGAALTTYISLAGRYCVLMPNSPRGGGISRKITSPADRRRLKEIVAELDIPPGMGLIVRTAGANRPKADIKRDCEYLMRLWDDIREHTLRSVAPALIYEEASLIKRAIRDVYSRDIDEVIVDGEEGWRAAHDFMRMLMPAHAKKVQLWRGNGQPLFAKYQVEAQLDAMLSPTVQLRSGGYLVINQTEALVAIDVNSGRATRERGIEETALRTNLEAAEEVARQIRLRDLAGLIVIDFIDMDARKHNAMVERRLKEALKADRARIQVGHISHFGLLEMSRQRLRPSLAETSFSPCPHCGGTGHVRSVESSAIHVLRAIEEEGAKGRAAAIRVQVATPVALYLLNHKRDRLADIEARYAMRVTFEPDDSLVPPQTRIDRLKPQLAETERPPAVRPVTGPVMAAAPAIGDEAEEQEAPPEGPVEPDTTEVEPAPAEAGASGVMGEETELRRRRRRRRRGGRREGLPAGPLAEGTPQPVVGPESVPSFDDALPPEAAPPFAAAEASPVRERSADTEMARRPRRRGRRGGRRRTMEEAAMTPATGQPYVGPTPAEPFGIQPYDVFDMIDEAGAPPPAAAYPTLHPPTNDDQPVIAKEQSAVAADQPVLAESPAATPAADPLSAPPPAPTPVPAEAAPAEPVAAEPVTAEPVTAEPVTAEPVTAPSAPIIQPIIIGTEEPPPAERKRGWWRR